MTWREVKRTAPCEVCGKPDWCGQSDDGAIRCMRIADPPAGWRKVKECSDGGTVFRPADEPPDHSGTRGRAPKPAKARSVRTFQTLERAVAAAARSIGGQHAATWTYHDANGRDVMYVARFNLSDGDKQFRPFHRDDAAYVMGDPKQPLPLYRRMALNGQSRVFVLEGEKCADAAAALGLVATTSAHGSKAAAKTDWQPLVGAEVVILTDNDDPGEHFGDDVAHILLALDPQARVRILDLPDLLPGEDIVEFIEDRRSDAKDDRAIRREIEDLAALAEFVKPDRRESKRLQYRPFPVAALPEPARGFVRQCTVAIGCDAAYIALPLLSALASAIGNSRRIRLKRGWCEPAIIWTAIVGDSGTLKTPAFKQVMQAVRARQAQSLKQYAEAMEDYERNRAKYDRAYQQWKRRKGDEDPPTKPEPPQARRYLVADTTVEAIAPILRENPRGVLLARDELAGWIGSFDRYAGGKGGADAAHWLSMHNAELIIVDRKTGEPRTILVPRASVSVTGGIQPAILERALGIEHRESGLAARLLMAWPPRRPKRWTEAEISAGMEQSIATIFDSLYTLEPARDSDCDPQPIDVPMTSAGLAAWKAFYNEHAEEQAELTGDLSAAWSKLEGYAARLALVVHFIRWAAGDPTLGDPDRIDEVSIAAGVTLSRWFGHEARRAYAMLGESDEDRGRRRLIELIERKGGSVTVREWQRSRSLKSTGDAELELKDLEAAGYGVLRPAPQAGRGRPSIAFTLHSDTPDTDNKHSREPEPGFSSVSESSEESQATEEAA